MANLGTKILQSGDMSDPFLYLSQSFSWAVTKYHVGVGWAVTKYHVEVDWAVTKY